MITLNEMADGKLQPGACVICLADICGPSLQPMDQTTLNAVRNCLQQSANLLWVTAYDGDTENTALGSSFAYTGIKDGLLRTLRNEFALSRIVSLTIGDGPRDVASCARYATWVFDSAFGKRGGDNEYLVRDGQILIGRLVDDIDTNRDLTSSIVPQAVTEHWLPGPPLTLAIQTRG